MDRCILVPYDFSNESDFAIQHAYEFASRSGLSIKLIHVVNSEKEIFDWKIEIEKVIKKIPNEKKIKITAEVRAGKLFDTIYNYGLEVNTYLAVMGTHGEKTLHKATRLIKQFVKIPFVLVQRPILTNNFDKICVPITDDKKLRSKIQWIRHLECLFKNKVFLCPVKYKDTDRYEEVYKNVQFATDVFEEYAIDFDIHWISEYNATDELYNYMYEIDPYLVLFMTSQYKKIVFDLKIPQNIEFAKKIPVMCVNYRTDIKKIGGFN
ncbi:MAG: universal stress protein [Bacteroidales bacterium]|jgi:hypothetical protein|nr:universal stress protein [Bacteroidales bacterium]